MRAWGIAYGLIGCFLLAGYVYGEHRGWIYGSAVQKETLPASVRSSPGGYRSHSFWFSGFHGGK